MLSSIVFTLCVALCVGYSSAEVSECLICDSNTDPNCAQNPGNIIAQKCTSQPSFTECYARIVNGVTYRGCFRDLDEGIQNFCKNDSIGANCSFCENVNGAKGCNNHIFPGHRLTCHHCSDNSLSSECSKVPVGNPIPCKNYSPDDKCYIRKTAKTIERGCLSDTSKCNNVSHCKICDGEGCNNEEGSNKDIPIAPSSAIKCSVALASIIMAFVTSIKVIF